ncbi:ABC transporter ATP-binding protein [Hathewaya histolytica]|uniref:Lipoprotein-releasing system ATP-binding protein LolD n=1 Tax=Hathewaya histolytica TaxID=1498 RepID=A0A4U9QX01_HATHI|nr:ABC transporter ATP-binding protein [Hathewaya histolytica]VTQ82979.1 lipoprotein-releasing system ATP-binding protein LolD [Hathewaya histolytica]
MSLIELKDINKIYGFGDSRIEALKNIDLNIEKGDMIAIMGASGSGKSTLLNILGCLDKPNSGSYLLDGKEISKLTKNEQASLRGNFFGFIVQYFALIEDYSVFENVKIPLDYTKISKKEKKERIIKLLKNLGIEDKISRNPNQLSGGQNQRVAIARALVNNPQVILADEPTGALDTKTSEEVMEIFKNINKEGKTIIIVTHDSTIASQCQKIIHIKDGEIEKILK